VAPPTREGTALEEHCGTYSWAIMDGVSFDIED